MSHKTKNIKAKSPPENFYKRLYELVSKAYIRKGSLANTL